MRLKVFGQFADRCCLSGPVDARDHDDEGLVRIDVEGDFQGFEEVEQNVAHGGLNGLGGFQFVFFGTSAQGVQNVLGGLNADVAGEQERFEVFEQFIVDLAAGKEGFELAAQLGARTRET